MKASQILQTLSFVSLIAAAAAAGACSSDDSSGDGDGDSGGDGDGDGNGLSFLFCEPADTCPPSVEGVDLTTPVSFTDDIYHDFFKGSCGGGSGCHGISTSAAADLYLGTEDEPLTDAEIEALVTQLTTAPSELASGTTNVVAGDWQASFLMAKLDGCQEDYSFACDGESQALLLSVCRGPCGDGMPASEGDMTNPNAFGTEPAKVDKVRAWIAQGAEYN